LHPRDGATLLELLAALTIGGLLAGVLGGALVAQLRLGRFVAHRTAAADAVRTAGAVLQGELRRTAAPDIRALSRDSLSIRAFRGVGRVCQTGHDRLTVLYRGDRLPDARKDSLLLLDGSGAERALLLLEVRHNNAACRPLDGETPLLLRVPPASMTSASGVVLTFESGTYYLSSRAMRYRLGAEGRQPLTAELFDMRATGLFPAPHGVRMNLLTTDGANVSAVATTAVSR
jgi:type II secretory pathway component PulJ